MNQQTKQQKRLAMKSRQLMGTIEVWRDVSQNRGADVHRMPGQPLIRRSAGRGEAISMK